MVYIGIDACSVSITVNVLRNFDSYDIQEDVAGE